MLFNSLSFLLFFPAAVLATFAAPRRAQNAVLLAASYLFYMGWNARYALLLAFCTLVTYVCARALGRTRGRGARRALMLAGLLSNLAILFFFKYGGFFCQIMGRLGLRVPRWDVLLPVGISFYTFQALGYMLDVYRGEIQPERSLMRYALFVSFFPQLVAGPIERSKNLLRQVREVHAFDFSRARDGLLLMLLGFFEKLVIADRASLYVDAIYGSWQNAAGWQIALATVVFAFQIYGDFGGYSHIATGAAKVLGFELMENFHQPYFAVSVRDFWRRWHVSLSTWFRDYLYIPLGGNRVGKLRRALNTMITFTVSGLWHGAAMHYVAWGAMNGALQVLESWLGAEKRTPRGAARIARMLATFAVIDCTWLFFRANALGTGARMASRIVRAFFAPAMASGFSAWQAGALAIGIAMLLALDALHANGKTLAGITDRAGHGCTATLALVATLGIVVFGVWGSDYSAQAFLYFQF